MHLKSNDDFIRALDDQNVKEKVVEVIINNIVVAYINDFESLNDQNCLISILLNRCNYDEMRQLIWFIWNSRKDDDQKLRNKTFELWPRLISVINIEIKEGKKLASQLCHWSAFIKKIDYDNKGLLLATAPFADEDYNSYEFLRNLAKLSDSQPFEVHDIWMKMLEGCTPDHPKEAIEQYLGNLIAKGSEGIRKAKEAADVYLKRGNDTLARYLRKLIEKVDD